MELSVTGLHNHDADSSAPRKDCLAYGEVTFSVDGHALLQGRECCAGVAAYRLLKTLFFEHLRGEEPLFPNSGEALIPSKSKRYVRMVGYSEGADFDIRHDREQIHIGTKEGEQYTVAYGEYRQVVLAFAEQLEQYYRQYRIPKATTDLEWRGYLAFLGEWDSLFCKAQNTVDANTVWLPETYFDDCEEVTEYDMLSVSNQGITLKSGKQILFRECVENYGKEYGRNTSCVGERDICNWSFLFYTSPSPTRIRFIKKGRLVEFFSRQNASQRFNQLRRTIEQYGYSTYDMS